MEIIANFAYIVHLTFIRTDDYVIEVWLRRLSNNKYSSDLHTTLAHTHHHPYRSHLPLKKSYVFYIVRRRA